MFSRHNEHSVFLELSSDVRDEQDWVIGQLRVLEIPLDITTLAVEPSSTLLAIGTASGAIHIHGGPGVQCKITVPHGTGVRFLNFASSAQKILCLGLLPKNHSDIQAIDSFKDDNSQLHTWDLTTFGGPEYVTAARFDQVNSVTLSPSLSHVFLGLQTGEVKTYDLICLQKSPYTIPNMWKLYEANMLARGIPAMTAQTIQPCVEQVIHPRDLNLMFVAYSGGVILSNLTERNTVRAYELMLPPGAPGGLGYGAEHVLTHRRPAVTSLSVHPSGHFFAVGHADGSIAFWAVDDDTQPLLVRTLNEEDVNVVDSIRLQEQLEKGPTQGAHQTYREPVFKLSWSGYSNSSDPRGGDTTLTILGGLEKSQTFGFTVLLLPAFQPSDAPADPSIPQDTLHPFFKIAMRKSLSPLKSHFYETKGELQDYFLVPRYDLHFSGSHDPYAILCLINTIENTRVAVSFQFPPPQWIALLGDQADSPSSPDTTSEVAESSGPEKIDLPFQLLSGASGLMGGTLLAVGNDVYRTFIDTKPTKQNLKLKIEGGVAFADQTKQNELRLAKYQPHRILLTYYQDLSIRFYDASAQLLISGDNEALKNHFPSPLIDFTVELEHLLLNPSMKDAALSKTPLSIHCVQLAPEAHEFAVILKSGEIIVYRPSSTSSPLTAGTASVGSDSQIVLLDPKICGSGSVFSPYFLLKTRALVEACAISNIGFLAVSYSDGALLIIDMRGPRVILRSALRNKHRKGPSVSGHPNPHPDIISSLTWSITPVDKDPKLKVRLVAARASGTVEVYTLIHSGNPASWSVIGEPPLVCKGLPDPVPDGIFILDGRTGMRMGASRSLLAASFHSESTAPSLFVIVGAKGARCSSNINGERIGKVEWGNRGGGSIIEAQVVEQMSAKALVVLTDKQEAIAYSLPYLEHIKTIQLLPIPSLPLSIDESGDFIAFTPQAKTGIITCMTYGTLFDIRRAYSPPEIDFASKASKVAQPAPISMGPASLLGSWFSFKQPLTGDQIDSLLGGPDRPVPETRSDPADASEGGVTTTAANAAANIAASAAAAQTSIYNRLTTALNERGQLLGDLEERFNSLEADSKSMVAQARKLAAQQTAKSWFGF